MYELIATDIDDTVLAIDGSLPEANRTALRRLHESGIVVVFASGRADVSIQGVAAHIVDLADDEYLISFNGARVVSAESRTPLVQMLMTREMVEEVLEYTRPLGLVVQAYADRRFLVERDSGRSEQYSKDTAMEYDVVGDLAAAVGETGGTPKLLIIDDHEVLATHLPPLKEIGHRSSAGRFTATFSKPKYLEVVREGVNKGVALKRLAEHLGIPVEATVAVGDSLNDSEMIKAAGLGVAVANAREELKAIADIVTSATADEGAIAEVARRFFDVSI